VSFTGRASLAVSGPAISCQRNTSVGSENPARAKAIAALAPASEAIAPGQFRRLGGSGGFVSFDCVIVLRSP
jgi:hypothetical protein